MSGKPLRFIHASDLHLEQPLHGVGHVPEHLVSTFLDAPFTAAQRLFDLAVSEQVDFVLLAGDILNPLAAGPRGLDLLLREFRRLEENDIGVYWAHGVAEQASEWPADIPLPANVTIFSDVHVDSVTHRRDKQPICTIQGSATSDHKTFSVDEFSGDASLPTIAIAYGRDSESGRVEPNTSLAERDIMYWALGGLHASKTICEDGTTAMYCGSPQGRRPSEESAHGCLLVELDRRGRLIKRQVNLDSVRWFNIRIEMEDDLNRGNLLQLLRDRSHQLADSLPDHQLLMRWIIADSDELTDSSSDILVGQLREGVLADELLEALRSEFGMRTPGVWSVEFDVLPPTVLPAGWFEEDTILGDLLRVVQQAQEHPEQRLAHGGLPEGAQIAETISAALEIRSPEERLMILREVAALSIDLLRGDRILSTDFVLPAAQGSGAFLPTNPT